MNNSLVQIASSINLNVKETTIFLQDYIIDCEQIVSITAPEQIEVWENKKKNIISLEIINPDLLEQVSTLTIGLADESVVSLVLIKSKKTIHTIHFIPQSYVRNIQIAGDFNSWNPKGYDFTYKDGTWQYSLEIEPGNYSYQLIVDGNWINDPCNHEVIENGYGGYNSMLCVPFNKTENEISIETEKVLNENLVIKIRGSITGYVVIWNNTLINDLYTFQHLQKLLITIPIEAHKIERSFIRVYAFDDNGTSNDLLIPLENGKVILQSKCLQRDDKESQVIYFALIDRFNNGDDSNNNPLKDPDVHPKMNYFGGDFIGITKKIKDGYFTNLGITTIWISPIIKNPDFPCVKLTQKSSGYHGYWPIDSKKIEDRFGTEQEFIDLVNTAHKHNLNIILDYVANHVHKDNPILNNKTDWITPLYLSDGSKNIGRWEDQRFSTWFEDFLPTLNYDNPEVIETMTDIAVEWIKKYNLDGFRHDATKHIQSEFWRTLTLKLKKQIVIPEGKRLFQIGETFGGREMLKSYINSGIHDSQFSFNMYYELRSAFLYDEVHFDKLSICLKQELQCFGFNHMLGNISGNHDLPRFISYAGEDLWMNQNAEHEGWNRHISVKNPNGYKKLLMVHAFNATIPGIPVIYYGDEIGMPGGGDPDNRRPMKFIGLNENESKSLKITQLIYQTRNKYLPLLYGDFTFIKIEKQILVYSRKYFEDIAIVFFNKTSHKQTIQITNDKNIQHLYSLLKNKVTVTSSSISIELDPYSFDILYNSHFSIKSEEKISEYYIS